MGEDEPSLSVPIAVSVATMNVGNDMAPDARLVEAVREMAPDIVAFEELNRRQAEHLAGALEDVWPYRFTFGDSYEGRGVFSRYPLHGETVLEIASNRPDARVEIEIEGQVLTLLVGHPRPPKLRGRTLDIPFALQRQLLRLADLALESSPAVLVGDFNIRPDTSIYARLRERGLVDAFAASGTGPERTFPVRLERGKAVAGRKVRVKTPPLFRIDYVWHTPDIRSVETRVGVDTGADHLPVLSRLAIPRALPAVSEPEAGGRDDDEPGTRP
jgi:endonuclease/exonuclease/phosphatase (EEP) superfamily protein YafD